MRNPKLRIAFSAVCVVVCLLLILLWTRSWSAQNPSLNYYGDEWKYKVPAQRFYKVFSNRGGLRLMTASWTGSWSIPVLEDNRTVIGFGVLNGPTSLYVRLPYWFLVSLAALCAAAPSFPWSRRFSLRTLLIATTLVAIALGLIVWASR